MQVGIVYTGVTEQLVENVDKELRQALGSSVKLKSYSNPEILASLRKSGGVNAWAAKELMALYWQAVDDGATVLYNACSSVGDVVLAARPMFDLLDVKLVAIDEEMAMEAVRSASRIAVVATLRTTLEPTCRLIRRCAEKQGKSVEIIESVVDVFGLEPEPFAEALTAAGVQAAKQADVILLAQGSMAWCEGRIAEATGLPVLSSPRFGAIGLKNAVEGK